MMPSSNAPFQVLSLTLFKWSLGLIQRPMILVHNSLVNIFNNEEAVLKISQECYSEFPLCFGSGWELHWLISPDLRAFPIVLHSKIWIHSLLSLHTMLQSSYISHLQWLYSLKGRKYLVVIMRSAHQNIQLTHFCSSCVPGIQLWDPQWVHCPAQWCSPQMQHSQLCGWLCVSGWLGWQSGRVLPSQRWSW